jgi:hypothetical protein
VEGGGAKGFIRNRTRVWDLTRKVTDVRVPRGALFVSFRTAGWWAHAAFFFYFGAQAIAAQ